MSAHTGSAHVHTHTHPLMYSCTYTVMLAYSFIHTHLFTHSYTHLLLHTLYTVMPTLAFTRVHMPHQTIPFMCLHTMHTRTPCRQEQSSAPSPGRGAPHPENLLSQQALPAGLRLRLHRKPSEQRQRHSVWRPLRALPFQSSPTALVGSSLHALSWRQNGPLAPRLSLLVGISQHSSLLTLKESVPPSHPKTREWGVGGAMAVSRSCEWWRGADSPGWLVQWSPSFPQRKQNWGHQMSEYLGHIRPSPSGLRGHTNVSSGPLLVWDQGARSRSVPDVCLHTSSWSVATQKIKLTMGGSSQLTGWLAAWARDRTLRLYPRPYRGTERWLHLPGPL